jgi:hypothetical protein
MIRSLLIACILAVPRMLAHSVWIEPLPSGELVLRFAEPDGRYERSPGHLDELQLPVACRSISTNRVPVAVEKRNDHYLLTSAVPTEAVLVETAYPVLPSAAGGGRRPLFYARWHPEGASAPEPGLTLDLVPTGRPGEVRILFRGKPLPGVKATLRTPDEKERELTADESGLVTFESTQPGLHLLTVARHREALAGFAGGKPFSMTSHNAALAWMTPNPGSEPQ